MFPYGFSNFSNFYRMYNFASVIEDKLSSPNYSVDDLLDEDEMMIHEIKSGNPKILNFLDKKNVKKLIEYITKEPTEDEQKRGHKYPFMSAEILNAEINKILDFFLIPDAELEMKDKILKNIDNELSFSDEFPEVKSKGPAEGDKSEPESDLTKAQEDNQSKPENEEFVDVVEEKMDEGVEKNEIKEKEVEKASDEEKEQAVVETNNTPKTEGAEATDKENQESDTNPDIDNNAIVNNENENNNINSNNNENAPEQAAKAEEQPSDRIELLEFLLEFIETESELNYVLAGYFSKFFIALLNRNSAAIIRYLYKKKPETLERFLTHIKIKGISDIIPKLILHTFENSLNTGNNATSISGNFDSTNPASESNKNLSVNPDYIDQRNLLITKLFAKLNLENDIETTNNLVNSCIEVLENKSVLEFILNDKTILESIFNNLTINLNLPENAHLSSYNYKEILILLLNVLRFSIMENMKLPAISQSSADDVVNFSNEEIINKINNTLLGELIVNNVDKIIKNFEFEEKEKEVESEFANDTTYGIKARMLGYKRIKIVEFIHLSLTYFKNVSLVIDSRLVESNFMKIGLDYLLEFQWNNQYQIDFTNLLKYIFSNANNHNVLINHIFQDLKFLDYIIKNYNEFNFLFNSNRKINNGYFANLIELSNKINSSTDDLIKSFITEDWKTFCSDKIQNWANLFSRKLCYEEKNSNFFNNYFDNYYESNTGKTAESELTSNETKDADEANKENNLVEINHNQENETENKNSEYDLGGFEFVDEHNSHEADVEKMMLSPQSKLKVDEVVEYDDLNFWKINLNADNINLDDLEN